MNRERCYVVPESKLINLLICEMECEMNARDGVDNWSWYGNSYNDVVKEFWPGVEFPGEDEEGDLPDMYSCAQARLEGGEFQEQFDINEFLSNYEDM